MKVFLNYVISSSLKFSLYDKKKKLLYFWHTFKVQSSLLSLIWMGNILNTLCKTIINMETVIRVVRFFFPFKSVYIKHYTLSEICQANFESIGRLILAQSAFIYTKPSHMSFNPYHFFFEHLRPYVLTLENYTHTFKL